jgi:transposase
VPSAPGIDDELDVGYWRARAVRAEAQVEELLAENAALRGRVAELAEQVNQLHETVTTLSKLLFGASSERSGPAGRGDDASQPGGLEQGTPTSGKRGQRPGRPGHGRRDYAHLETEEHVIDVGDDQRYCGTCRTPLEFLGTEDSEQLDWRVKVIRIVWRRRRYRRTCTCAGPRTVCAPPPPKPVPKGLFTSVFLAQLVLEKYVLGRPVHRIITALEAAGAQIASGTLVGALKQIAPLLAPWAAAIAERGRRAAHVHADETSWQVFEDVAGKDGHRWWLWTFVSADTTVFVMDTSRSAEVAARQLGIDRDQAALETGRHLIISSDFHTAYQSLARIDGIEPLWCYAHIRRYFLRAAAAHPEQLGTWKDAWIERFAVLYRSHHALAVTVPGTPAHDQALGRWQRAFTDIDAHRRLATQDAQAGILHPAAAKVINTLNNEWDGLARHQHYPQLPLDNNPAERSLRNSVIGRKNFYGSGSVWAAHLAADAWTITATAAQHNLEPLALLTDYLDACAAAGGTPPTGTDLEAFLPWTPQGRARRRRTDQQPADPGP